jgi:hypothetical protein
MVWHSFLVASLAVFADGPIPGHGQTAVLADADTLPFSGQLDALIDLDGKTDRDVFAGGHGPLFYFFRRSSSKKC